jgi:hypothetical protein
MDKMMINERGQATISNDGATIMKLLDVVHPAARILVDIAKSQDAEVCLFYVLLLLSLMVVMIMLLLLCFTQHFQNK